MTVTFIWVFLWIPVGLLYGNCRVTAWATDGAPGERTGSAPGAQVEAVHLYGRKGQSLAPLRAQLRADCQWRRISLWRLLLVEFSCEPTTLVSVFPFISDYLFQCDNLSSYMVSKDQPNFSAYLLVIYLYAHWLYICANGFIMKNLLRNAKNIVYVL